MSYDYLRSRPSKSGQSIFEKLGVSFHDVASLPISYLNLSKPTADMLSSQHTRVDDEIVHRFTTMGDLVKCGYVEMLKIAESKVYPMHASEILYEIELSLARYALKLRGTDFTVYDIRVDDLSLGDGTKEFIKRNMRAKTIGDLYVIGASRFKQYFEDVKNGKKMQQDALNAMMEFGTSPERVYNKDDMEESLSALEPQDMEDEEEEEVGQAQYLFKSIKRSLEAEKQKKSEKEDMKEQPAVVEKKSTNSTEPQVGGLRATVTYKTITETPSSDLSFAAPPVFRDRSEEKPSISAETITEKAVLAEPQTVIDPEVMERYKKMTERIKPNGRYDYSKLFMQIVKKYKSIYEFLKDVGLTYGILDSVYKGRPFREKTMAMMCKTLGCKPEDLCEINSNYQEIPKEKVKPKATFVTNENATRSGRTLHVGGSIPSDLSKEELLSKPIEALGLNWKYIKLLKYYIAGLTTVGDLVKQTRRGLIDAGISEHIALQISTTLKSYGLSLTDGRTLQDAVNKRKVSINASRFKDRRTEVYVTTVHVKPAHSNKLLGGAEQQPKTQTDEQTKEGEKTMPQENTKNIRPAAFKNGSKIKCKFYPNGYIVEIGQIARRYKPYSPKNAEMGKQM